MTFAPLNFVVESKNNKLENRLLREEKILIVFSSEYEEDANALMLNNSDHIYLRINVSRYFYIFYLLEV